ncbi:hypothetical protein METP2_02314 [Methanosarcinales archaeon]|nr:DUF4157 domain-containing protein [Candidatus Methanoperedens sp.]CAG0986641.1 hypothetical protein METP2_02314 [Methanosarcinales archaeon]
MVEATQVSAKASVANKENKVPSTQKSDFVQSMNSPVEQILFLQRTIGNQAVGRLLKSGALQAKLKVGQPGDTYEQEADRVAEQVMRMPQMQVQGSRGTEVSGHGHPIQRKCPGCNKGTKIGKEEEDEKLWKKEASGPAPEVQASSDLQQKLNTSKGSGRTLPEDTRSSFESAIGADFSNVNIHTGTDAAEMNKELGAQAFTHGSDIYFNEGKYDPSSISGKRLLAHELTHTVQQGSALRTKKQAGYEGGYLKSGAPNVQAAWYNFDIPFTDYQFDPSIEGIKTAGNLAKDTVVEGFEWIVDEIKALISSGIDWLNEKWNSIKEFASSGFESLKKSFTDILGFVQSPLNFIQNAIMSFDVESLAAAWKKFTGIVSGIWKGFKVLTDNLLLQVNNIWAGISEFATSLLDKVYDLTQNFLFKKLPDALQKIAYALIDKVKSLWKSINDGWETIFNKIKTWIDSALETVSQFVNNVISFGINTIIEGIRQFGELVLFLKDLFANPKKYIGILAAKGVEALEGVEGRFSGIVSKYFGNSKKTGPTTAITGTIQRQQDTGNAAGVKNSAGWSEIGSGIQELMGKKWNEFKSNPWSVVTGLLWDMFLPIVGNAKDVIQLFKDIWKIVTGPLSASSLEELWTSFLQLLDIPILIYNTVVSILMRSLMLPLIVASFIPHPLVKGIAAAVGYGLLGAFVQVELANVGHKLLLLKTGATTKAQKEEAYNRIADSFIALAMTAVIIVVMLILHFIVNVIKGIYNLVKGKVFHVETAPVEGKGTPGEGKASKAGETPRLKGEIASTDGQRSIKVTEKGKIWICASPCEEIRLKYEAQIKENPKFNDRIKALEEGYSDLSPGQKSVRDAQIRQLEQELADIKLAREGGARAPKEVKWPPDPPRGNKPPITAPDAAEWRYQRYVYEKFQEGASPKDVLPPDEWMSRYFDPTAEGGRPGRPGGPEQVAAKKELAAEGIKIVENVELGGRYPDGVDPRPNALGGKGYYEVGKMLESGIPEARERIKIADEIKAMGPNDTVTFVDKSDVTKRVIYQKGSTPENPTSKTF